MPAVSGKGNNETVERFDAIKSVLADRFGFSALTGMVVSTQFT
jgi:hypothetical protein